MPIEFRVDHRQRLVIARGHGTFTAADMFRYQAEVWSRPDVAGYDELIDTTDVQRFETPKAERARTLADVSAQMDAPTASRFAIVAPTDLAYGLGRMYQAFRQTNERSTKDVAVFRSLSEALHWLGRDNDACEI